MFLSVTVLKLLLLHEVLSCLKLCPISLLFNCECFNGVYNLFCSDSEFSIHEPLKKNFSVLMKLLLHPLCTEKMGRRDSVYSRNLAADGKQFWLL